MKQLKESHLADKQQNDCSVKSLDPNQFNSQVPITGIKSQTAQIALDHSANWSRSCRNAAPGDLNSNNPLQISPHFMRDLASTEPEESQHRKKSAGRIRIPARKKGGGSFRSINHPWRTLQIENSNKSQVATHKNSKVNLPSECEPPSSNPRQNYRWKQQQSGGKSKWPAVRRTGRSSTWKHRARLRALQFTYRD